MGLPDDFRLRSGDEGGVKPVTELIVAEEEDLLVGLLGLSQWMRVVAEDVMFAKELT